jgi:hypothetical protein
MVITGTPQHVGTVNSLQNWMQIIQWQTSKGISCWSYRKGTVWERAGWSSFWSKRYTKESLWPPSKLFHRCVLFKSWSPVFSQINPIGIYVQINEFVKRARAAKIHAYIIGHLKNQMPTMMGKAKAQQRLIDNLEDEFAKVCISSHL